MKLSSDAKRAVSIGLSEKSRDLGRLWTSKNIVAEVPGSLGQQVLSLSGPKINWLPFTKIETSIGVVGLLDHQTLLIRLRLQHVSFVSIYKAATWRLANHFSMDAGPSSAVKLVKLQLRGSSAWARLRLEDPTKCSYFAFP